MSIEELLERLRQVGTARARPSCYDGAVQMTTLPEVLESLGLQAIKMGSTLNRTYPNKLQCAKLRCGVCDLWILYQFFHYPDLWITPELPPVYSRFVLNRNSYFASTQHGYPELITEYFTWAPHGLDQAVLRELFK